MPVTATPSTAAAGTWTPIVLSPTPRGTARLHAEFTIMPARSMHARPAALRAVRWFGRVPDTDAHAAGRYLSTYLSLTLPAILRGDGDAAWAAEVAVCGDPKTLVTARRHFAEVTRAGADPMVLLALRGSRLTVRERLLVARSGLTPTEAHDLQTRRALDLDAIAALAALRTA